MGLAGAAWRHLGLAGAMWAIWCQLGLCGAILAKWSYMGPAGAVGKQLPPTHKAKVNQTAYLVVILL